MAKTDQEIIESVLAGDKKAFSELVNRHKDRAMTLAVRMLKNREEAEEALQDAFLRAFNALSRFEWRSSFSTWFYRIVYNVCSTALSKKGEDIHISISDNEEEMKRELPDAEPGPDVQLESSEMRSVVVDEINRLPATYSSVVTMFFLHEMSYDEIVSVTGMPLGTVKAKLFRARLLLQKAIEGRLQENVEIATGKIAAAFR
ncbi:MAG TPA: sigma-70 family RNA polymerase sigma factor [Bacteroidota bacterium]|nr:sigma-70 family RNA polymerase sigma factor [Bacteroidota bacterium]